MAKRVFLALAILFLVAALAGAQGKGTISYKIDGKPFSFSGGEFEYHVNDGYASLTYEKGDVFTLPNTIGKKGGATGVTIQVGGEESDIPGLHQSDTPDEIPVYFSWYEIVKDQKTGKMKDVIQHTLSLDSGNREKMFIKIKIDSFGPAGSLVTGTFSASVRDDEEKLHSVTDGVFIVPRVDKEE